MRGYESPPRFLNFYRRATRRRTGTAAARDHARRADAAGRADRRRSAQAVDAALAELAAAPARRPGARAHVRSAAAGRGERRPVHGSLYEAIVLVVLVSLIGFWEWRSALLMALSIPITLAMTFGMMYAARHRPAAGLDRVADHRARPAGRRSGRRRRRDQARARPRAIRALDRRVARARPSWHAILFATITNIVAYLPFLLLPGDTGKFIYSLPVVIDVLAGGVAPRVDDVHSAARLLPAAAASAEPTIEERRTSGLRRGSTTASAAGRSSIAGACWRRRSSCSLARRRRSRAS